MPILIDGHNLIGKTPELSLEDPDDEAKLVQRVRQYCLRHRRRAVVVFDVGLFGGTGQTLSTPEVEVVFASGRQSADDLIRNHLQRERDPRGWTVVSSDRKVQQVARALGARVISSEAFAAMLEEAPGKGERAKGKGERAEGKEKPSARLTEEEIQAWLD
ncbi:MAG: hypothetical protein D6793_03830, partial [Thermoflexia bacterium]